MAAFAWAHDKMVTPISRSNTETVGTVCDKPQPARPMDVALVGDVVHITWEGNHNDATQDVVLNIFSWPQETSTNPAPQTINILNTFTYNNKAGDITIPQLDPGTYALRWQWPFNGVLYVSCHDYAIAGAGADRNAIQSCINDPTCNVNQEAVQATNNASSGSLSSNDKIAIAFLSILFILCCVGVTAFFVFSAKPELWSRIRNRA